MKLFRGLLAVSLLAASGGCRRSSTPGEKARDFPVVLISIDTLRADHVPCYGYRNGETPNLDAFRRDAILFQNAYSHCPLTLPSHVSMLTGLRPAQHGVRDNMGYRFDPARHPMLPAMLRPRGYSSGAAVSAWVLRGATGIGPAFDFFDDAIEGTLSRMALSEVQRSGAETVARSIAWLEKRRDGRFFFFLHLYEPHTPYSPPEPFRSRIPLPYDGEIAAADLYVGTFLHALKRLGYYDRALVIVTSDHGEGLGDHGEEEHGILLYREVLRVPLLVKLPDSSRAGARIDEPVGLVDLVPTILGELHVKPPAGLAGRSLLEALSNRGISSETLYSRLHLGWSELRSLTNGRYHLISGARAELFDELRDPEERNDLSASNSAELNAMERILDREGARFVEPAAPTSEEARKLAALGYLSGGTAATGALPDPRDRLSVLRDLGRAFDLTRSGRDREAVEALRQILSREPRLFDAQYELAEALARLGRFPEARDEYLKSLALEPSLAGEIGLALGRVDLRLDRLDQAEGEARLSIASSPAAEVLLGEIALRRDDAAGALASLDRAKARLTANRAPAPENLEFLRGDALARLRRNAEAEEAFQAEIRSYPKNSPAFSKLAIVEALEGKTISLVRGRLEEMYRANPTPETVRLAAETLESLGDRQAAAAWRKRNPRR